MTRELASGLDPTAQDDRSLQPGPIWPTLNGIPPIALICLTVATTTGGTARTFSPANQSPSICVPCGEREEDAVSAGVPMVTTYDGSASEDLGSSPSQAELDALIAAAQRDAYIEYRDALFAKAEDLGLECDWLNCPSQLVDCFAGFPLNQMFVPATVSMVTSDPEEFGSTGIWSVSVVIEIIGQTDVDFLCTDCPDYIPGC